jgi:hypothetical protein
VGGARFGCQTGCECGCRHARLAPTASTWSRIAGSSATSQSSSSNSLHRGSKIHVDPYIPLADLLFLYFTLNSKSRGRKQKIALQQSAYSAPNTVHALNPLLWPLLLRVEKGAPTPRLCRCSLPRALGLASAVPSLSPPASRTRPPSPLPPPCRLPRDSPPTRSSRGEEDPSVRCIQCRRRPRRRPMDLAATELGIPHHR